MADAIPIGSIGGEIGPPAAGTGSGGGTTPVPVENIAPVAPVASGGSSGPSLSVTGASGGNGNTGSVLLVILGLVLIVGGVMLAKRK